MSVMKNFRSRWAAAKPPRKENGKMKKFNVNIHYEGGWMFEIEAENADEAKETAEQMFENVSDRELIANLGDVFVDDCWEMKIDAE